MPNSPARDRTWEDDVNPPPTGKEIVVPVQTMLLVFRGKDISPATFSHVASDYSRKSPQGEVEMSLAPEVEHYRDMLELNLVRPGHSDEKEEIHYLVARKVGDHPWTMTQVDQPEDAKSEVEKIEDQRQGRPVKPASEFTSAPDSGLTQEFFDRTWGTVDTAAGLQ